MDGSQLNEGWTDFRGSPVYWLAPEFWNPMTGVLRLVLVGEDPNALSTATRQKRIVEFLKLQGDGRYCSPEIARRMKRLMIERLGTDTPWRGVPPADIAALPVESLTDPLPQCSEKHAQTAIPFA